jgi:hypothetical protein
MQAAHAAHPKRIRQPSRYIRRIGETRCSFRIFFSRIEA